MQHVFYMVVASLWGIHVFGLWEVAHVSRVCRPAPACNTCFIWWWLRHYGEGEREMWPKLATIESNCGIEMQLDECVRSLREKLSSRQGREGMSLPL